MAIAASGAIRWSNMWMASIASRHSSGMSAAA